MKIEASAPTRVDLAGATLDIWPLYLYHADAQTLNVAITLRAYCWLTHRSDRRILIRSLDTGQSVDVADWSELSTTSELRLIGRILHFFRASGVEVVTRSDSPVGAGIAGSSALNVALCAAAARWQNRPLTSDELLQIALNVEAQAIEVPTGAQDFRPAYYGGISAVELGEDGVRRVALDVDPSELGRRLVIAYTGASRHSGVNNWEITKAHIDGDRRVFDHFERIRDIAVALRAALVKSDWTEVGRHVAAEWDTRKQLAPGVTTAAIDRLIERARAAGALGAKVCGAGGGGCIACIAEPTSVPAVRHALAAGGAELLECGVDSAGLRVVVGGRAV